jgi:GGDEF domain-containing protein
VLERLRPVTPAGQTFSAGLATWDGTETSKELIARADRALYAAKSSGRNRTLTATESIGGASRRPASAVHAKFAASGAM